MGMWPPQRLQSTHCQLAIQWTSASHQYWTAISIPLQGVSWKHTSSNSVPNTRATSSLKRLYVLVKPDWVHLWWTPECSRGGDLGSDYHLMVVTLQLKLKKANQWSERQFEVVLFKKTDRQMKTKFVWYDDRKPNSMKVLKRDGCIWRKHLQEIVMGSIPVLRYYRDVFTKR